jgi:hypothetical protein
MVFPLGMYTTSSWRLARSFDLDFLLAVPRLVVFIALAAWLVTMAALLLHLAHAAARLHAQRPAGGAFSPGGVRREQG